jgi:hypothetical protein
MAVYDIHRLQWLVLRFLRGLRETLALLDIPPDRRAAHGNAMEAAIDYSPGGDD